MGNRSSSAVPFISLYNPADGHDHNFEPCVSAALMADGRTVRVVAAHGYGSIDVSYNVSAGHIYFRVENITNWRADPKERHLQFGEVSTINAECSQRACSL